MTLKSEVMRSGCALWVCGTCNEGLSIDDSPLRPEAIRAREVRRDRQMYMKEYACPSRSLGPLDPANLERGCLLAINVYDLVNRFLSMWATPFTDHCAARRVFCDFDSFRRQLSQR